LAQADTGYPKHTAARSLLLAAESDFCVTSDLIVMTIQPHRRRQKISSMI